MKNILPFKKDIIFKTNLSEITSISLENTLNLKDDTISGDFIISGDYKVTDSSTTVEPFEFKLPFEIVLDERFDCSSASIDIDDFYYEIVNNNVLSVSIDVLVDHLKEKPIVLIDDLVDVTPVREVLVDEEELMKEREIKEAAKEEKVEVVEERKEVREDKINSLFSTNSFDNDVYVTYNIFILRDGDTLDSIMEKYNITLDELKKYNDVTDLKIGDKLIIPATNYEGN